MSEPTIDVPTFESLQQTAGADFIAELVDTFFVEAPLMLADLRDSLAAQDAERFRRAAHSLKSNSHTFGALPLGRMAKALELGGLPAVGDAGTRALDSLAQEYARASVALAELRNG